MEERKTIYLCLAHMSEEGFEQKYVKEAFDTNWVVPMGPNVNAFEQSLEDFVNCVKMSNEKLGVSSEAENTSNSSLLTPNSIIFYNGGNDYEHLSNWRRGVYRVSYLSGAAE